MRVTIRENERGFLFHKGQFKKMLEPGKHRFWGFGYRVEKLLLDEAFVNIDIDSSILLKDQNFKDSVTVVEVPDDKIALWFVNGNYRNYLPSGKHVLWTIYDKHAFEEIDIDEIEVGDRVSDYVMQRLPLKLYKKVEVAPYQKAPLFIDKKFVRLLDEGVYYYWLNGKSVDVYQTDTRLLQLDITGQEILTLDKVSLRINFVCQYKITDCVKIHTEIEDYKEQIHIAVQLALRDYIGKYKLDDILLNKDQISQAVLGSLIEREKDFFIEVKSADVKDIILPGEIREIMNTVLVAEKKAQANVITRREEVASTRSLLNTAKLMDENKTLYNLKQLEFLEKICENVGNISIGGKDILTELTNLIQREKE